MADVRRQISIYVESGQAQQAYDRLLAKEKALTTEIEKLKTAGKDFGKQSAELDKVTAALERQRKKVAGELSPSYRDLANTANKLTRELKAMSAEDAGFDEKKRQADAATLALDKYKRGLDSTKAGMANIAADNKFLSFMGKAATFVAGLVAFDSIGQIFSRVKQFASDSIKEYEAQAKVDAQLRESLNETGAKADEVFGKLLKQAGQLQQTTVFSDDAVENAQQALAVFGLTGDRIEEIIPLIADFASATNQDLATATEKIIKGLTGAERGLKQYGLTSDLVTGNVSKNFESVTGFLQKFNGASDTLASTSIGKQLQLQNQISENMERLGKALLPIKETFLSFQATFLSNLSKLIPAEQTEQDILRGTQKELNNQIEALKNGNFSQEERARLITEINTKYGQYLPNLLDESMTLSEIETLQENINKQFMQRILLMDYEEEIKQIYKDQKTALEGQYQSKKQLGELQAGAGALTDDGAAIAAQQKLLQTSAEFNQTIADNAPKRLEETETKYKALAEAMGAVWEQLKATLSEAPDKIVNATQEGGDEKLKKEQERLKEFGDKVNQLRKQLADAELSDDEQAIARVKDKYDKLLKEAETTYPQLYGLAKEYQQQLKTLQSQEEFSTVSELEYKASLNSLDNFYDEAKSKLREQLAEGHLNKEQYAAREEALEREKAKNKITIIEDYVGTVEEAETDLAEAKKALSDKEIEEKIAANEEKQKSNDKLKQQELADAQEIRDARIAAVKASTEVLTGLFQIGSNIEQRELQRFKKSNDEKKKILKQRLEAGIINEKQYNLAVERLDAELDKKSTDLKRKSWRRDKAASFISSLINTALAVTAALGSKPWTPANFILAAAVGAAGGVQAGVIASQPEPQFEQGGILKGPSHKDGGIDIVSRGRKIGEMEGDELILSKKFTRTNARYINPLLHASRTGKPLMEVLFPSRALPQVNLRRAYENANYFAEGGIIASGNRSVNRAASPDGGGIAPVVIDNSVMVSVLLRVEQRLIAIEEKTEPTDYNELAKTFRFMNEAMKKGI